MNVDETLDTIETVTVQATRLPNVWLMLAVGLGVVGLALLWRAAR